MRPTCDHGKVICVPCVWERGLREGDLERNIVALGKALEEIKTITDGSYGLYAESMVPRADVFHGQTPPWHGWTLCQAFEAGVALSAADMARAKTEQENEVAGLRKALEAADKWFAGWRPQATCCAHSGKEVAENISEVLKKNK